MSAPSHSNSHSSSLENPRSKEMHEHFYRSTSVREFLDKYLKPGDPKLPPNGQDIKSVKEIYNGHQKSDIYKQIVDAIQPHLSKEVICDTHKFKDSDGSQLSPDISLYPRSESFKKGRPEEKPSFAKMSMFIEIKASVNLDPFNDSAPYLEKDTIEAEAVRGQIGSYVAAISGQQFRTHVFSVSIYGRTARFIRWDRAGAVVSPQFDYVEKPALLVEFFYRYSRSSRSQQGFDDTAEAAKPRDVNHIGKEVAQQMKDANSLHSGFWKLQVPDRNDLKKMTSFLVSFPFHHTTLSPFARSTRGMLAFELQKKRLVFLKDYLRPLVSSIEKEGDIYATLEEKKVPHIAWFGTGNDISSHKTHSQELDPHKTRTCLVHHRLTLLTLARPLHLFKSSYECITAIADAMEAHDKAFSECGILHHDISEGNIMITDEGKGLLIDWDMCIRCSKDSLNMTSCRDARTGTWEFMSAKLLQDQEWTQNEVDDHESAFWVFIWVALHYMPTHANTGSGHNLTSLVNMFSYMTTHRDGTISGGNLKMWFLQNFWQECPLFENCKHLNTLAAELAGVFAIRYATVPTDEDRADYNDFLTELPLGSRHIAQHHVYQYDDKNTKLKRKGWLVSTLREFLNKPGWPEDDTWERQATQPLVSTKRKQNADDRDVEERLSKRSPYALRPRPGPSKKT